MKRFIVLSVFLFGLFQIQAQQATDSDELATTNTAADEAAVRAAIVDYVEGLYLVDSTRIEKSVHPSLRKIGYWYDKKNQVYHDNLEMTHQELVSLSAGWNKSGKRADQNSPKEITIFEVNDKTAIAKLTAAWGIDYFQLAKTGGQWYIMNVIWQSQP